MKKIYSLIIFLITISLLGIILIQVNWIKNVIQVKEEAFKETAKIALINAGKKIIALSTENNTLQLIKKFQNNPFYVEGEDGNQQKNFLANINNNQIKDIITKSLKDAGLNIPYFEYSVSCDVNTNSAFNNPELHSPGFYVLVSTGKPEIQAPIQAESGSEYESLVGNGNIWIIVPNNKSNIVKELGWMIAGAILFTLIIITAFFLTLSTLLKQKKISEIKSDFINNMTHEFKTPIATISLAVDALKNEKVIGNAEKTNYFTGIIKEENKRMNKQVESILQAALLDKQQLQLNLKPLHLNSIIENAFSYFTLNLEQNNGTASINLDAKADTILADEVHINNLIRNLMDNAIKYCKLDVPPHLKISTTNSGSSIFFFIEDNGIGMSKETVGRIFEKFYRAHTGNVHNVKGFGLGLSYVKAIIDAHKGRIKVDSTLGKGSIFTVELPLHKSL
jgi:two-component system, OmpR family, phosphate regulon sensor histidine kinase PhoR